MGEMKSSIIQEYLYNYVVSIVQWNMIDITNGGGDNQGWWLVVLGTIVNENM